MAFLFQGSKIIGGTKKIPLLAFVPRCSQRGFFLFARGHSLVSKFLDSSLIVRPSGKMFPPTVFVMPTTPVVFAAFMVFMALMAIRVFPAALLHQIITVVHPDSLNHGLIMRGCLKGDVPPKHFFKLNGMLSSPAFNIEVMSDSFVVHINTDFCVMR